MVEVKGRSEVKSEGHALIEGESRMEVNKHLHRLASHEVTSLTSGIALFMIVSIYMHERSHG